MFGKKKKTHRVLIVEDDALLLKVLVEVFISENFDVAVVENGTEVLDVAKSSNPEIILLDLILPGIDGFEVLKRLKEDEKTKQIPVVALSNLSDVADVKSIKALGAVEYFIKSNTEMKKIVQFVKSQLKI